MGYANAGYPTKIHKRIKRHHESKNVAIHYNKNFMNISNPNKKQKKLSGKNKKVNFLEKHANIQDLPVEVIQRIFVLSEGNSSMITLSKFFNACLRPTDYLISQVFWEKYTFDPHLYGLKDYIALSGKIILPTLFNNDMFFNFFISNYNCLLNEISQFINQNIVDQFVDGEIDVEQSYDFTKLITNDVDFPTIFYNNFSIYFTHPDVILELNRYFTIMDPWNLITSVIEWFFTSENQTNHYTKLSIALDLILEVSNTESTKIDSPLPLCTLLQYLYDQNIATILLPTLFGSSDISHSRREFIEEFISNFYASPEVVPHLSDPALWKLLQEISDMQLIDLVIRFGGEAQYSLFF